MQLFIGSFFFPYLLLLCSTIVGRVENCSSPTYAHSKPRTVKWSSMPTSTLDWWGDERASLVPFFFSPPSERSIIERWTKTDFSLLHASLSVPCSLVMSNESPQSSVVVLSTPSVFVLPEEWINLLPTLTYAVYQRGSADVFNLCHLFHDDEIDLVPGCQDWSRIEAWKRLRIFYDLPFPLGPIRQPHQQCTNGSWTVDASSMMRQWMAQRPPWTRFNATLPIAILTDRGSRPSAGLSGLEAQLELTYWMDSKCLTHC